LARALALAIVVPCVAHAAPSSPAGSPCSSPEGAHAAASAVATPSAAITLDRVIVEATRLRTVPAFDTPASTATVDLSSARSDASADVSEVLRGITGLLARDRQNLAQDTQLSIRGFGARATF